MISQLHQSRPGGTKDFCNGGINFGWSAIEDMFTREIQRMKEGKRVWVPGLKSNFIYRDSWTRLNVRPAKIMQASIILLSMTLVVSYNTVFCSKSMCSQS